MVAYISEVDYDGGAASNFVEVTAPVGEDLTGYQLIVYDKDGSIAIWGGEQAIYDISETTVSTDGSCNVYLFDDRVDNWADVHNDEALALIDGSGNVVQYISFKDPNTATEGPALGQSSVQVGEHSGGDKSLESNDGGATYTAIENSTPGEAVCICFTRGTSIATQKGEIPVEELSPGDMVLTMDHGYKPLRWIGSTKVEAKGRFARVLIREGALGNTRDLRVSLQHRMLLRSWRVQMLCDQFEALVPAKALINESTVLREEGGEVEYFHILFDRHEIVFAEGVPSESFHPGDMSLEKMDVDTRDEILALFPELRNGAAAYGPSARSTLKPFEAKVVWT